MDHDLIDKTHCIPLKYAWVTLQKHINIFLSSISFPILFPLVRKLLLYVGETLMIVSHEIGLGNTAI